LTYSARRFECTSNRGPKPIASHIFEPNSLDDAFERGFEVVSVPNIVLALVKRVRKCLSDREYGFLFSPLYTTADVTYREFPSDFF